MVFARILILFGMMCGTFSVIRAETIIDTRIFSADDMTKVFRWLKLNRIKKMPAEFLLELIATQKLYGMLGIKTDPMERIAIEEECDRQLQRIRQLTQELERQAPKPALEFKEAYQVIEIKNTGPDAQRKLNNFRTEFLQSDLKKTDIANFVTQYVDSHVGSAVYFYATPVFAEQLPQLDPQKNISTVMKNHDGYSVLCIIDVAQKNPHSIIMQQHIFGTILKHLKEMYKITLGAT